MSLKGVNQCCLSPIAQAYAELLAHPDTGPLVGIPNGDTIYSQKARLWVRDTATLGATTPNVHLLCQPFAALAKDCNVLSVVSDTAALPADLATGGQVTNALYSAADFAPTGVQGRLVAAVLRVKFAGTNLNAGGIEYGLMEPTHGSLASKTSANLMGYTSCLHRSVTHGEEWFEVHYRPIDHNDTSWVDTITRTNASTYTLKSDGNEVAWSAYPFMGIAVKGAAVSQTIQWEFFADVEYAGPNVVGKTLTPPDIQGFGTVLAAYSKYEEASAASQSRKSTEQASYISQTLRDYASNMLSASLPYVAQAANAAGAAILNRYAPRGRIPNRLQNLLQ